MPKPVGPDDEYPPHSRLKSDPDDFPQGRNSDLFGDAHRHNIVLLGKFGHRCVSQCLLQLSAAEAALAVARAALQELDPDVSDGHVHLPESPVQFVMPPSPPEAPADRGAASTPSSNFAAGVPGFSLPVLSNLTENAQQGWKAFDPRSSELDPVVFDQAILGCVGPQASEHDYQSVCNLPNKTPMSAVRSAAPRTIEIIWERCGNLWIPMISPEGKVSFVWLLSGLVFIVYEAYAVPVYLAFDVQAEDGFLVWVSIVNTYFLLDICFQLLLCYNNTNGLLVTRPRSVWKRYGRSWLLADLVAAVPWEWIGAGSEGGFRQATRSIRFFRAFRMFRLVRLIRIIKLRSLLERFESRIESNTVLIFCAGVVRIVLILLALLHWGACIWYSIGVNHEDESHDDGNPASWLSLHRKDYPYIGESQVEHYIYSLYFTLTTMTTVGYGDITPTNFSEVCFTMVLLFVSSLVFAGLMGTLTDMITALNSQRHELAQKKLMLSRYMTWRAVPRPLMMSMRQHLLFLWDANEGYDSYEESVKDQLPPVLRVELCYHIYGRILGHAPFFGWMKDYPICIKYLCEKVRSIFLEKGDHIFRMGQRNNQIYMLLTGQVVASRNESLFDKNRRPPTTSKGKSGSVLQTNQDDDMDELGIPRHKQSDAFPDMKSVVHKVQAATAEVTHRHSSIDLSKQMDGGNGRYGAKKSKFDMFDSDVLFMAHIELRRNDIRRAMAAKTVQRLWRRKHTYSNDHLTNGRGRNGKQGLQISRMRSRRIRAPAFFGESCLWQPLAQWEHPPLYMYSVRCESRGEIIFIPREAIVDCFERFSPWLQERYEDFCATVASRMREKFAFDSELSGWARDFAMADMALPGDDMALQALHTQALGRDLGHKSLDSQPLGREVSYMGAGESISLNRRGSLNGLRSGRSGTALGSHLDRMR